MDAAAALDACHASLDGDDLVVRNAAIERRWRFVAGRPRATALRDRDAGREWLRAPSERASLVPAGPLPDGEWRLALATRRGPVNAVSGPAMVATVTATRGDLRLEYRITAWADAPAIALQLVAPAGAAAAGDAMHGATAGTKELRALPDSDVVEALEIDPRGLVLTACELHEATDVHQNLVHERRYLLHPSEAIALAGNLFALDDPATGAGLLFVRSAPLPYARPVACAADLWLRGGTLLIAGNGLDADGGAGYPSTVVAYAGGVPGRIAALQRLQRALRRYDPKRDGLALCNTWGDRSRDGRLSEAFMLEEIRAAVRLGFDAVQIDDGWQRGVTQNSVTKGGVWEGFWKADPGFWQPHPERFPRGLKPVAEAARAAGLRFGLWFAPDSSDDFARWREDADVVLGFHGEHAVDYVKVDGVKMRSKRGERNIAAFYDAVIDGSGGAVVMDQDVTDEVRPGFLAMMHTGPLFVENRYSDWGSWWPHATARNLWQLAHWIDPLRLRMELLNTARNQDRYGDHPLAPARYSPGWLFASVMAANPLGWFEAQGLPPAYLDEVGALARRWRAHRAAIHGGAIIPVGDAPDGASWFGFVSVAADGLSAHAIVLRERSPRAVRAFPVPLARAEAGAVEVLGGTGSAIWAGGELSVAIPEPLGFVWVRLTAR